MRLLHRKHLKVLQASLLTLWVLAAGTLTSASAVACEGACMSVGSVAVVAGSNGVVVEIVGQADVPIRGFSLAVGHDPSRLRLVQIEPGSRFEESEFITETIRNQPSPESAPYGAFFAIFDSRAPLDREPVDIREPTVLAKFVYDVQPGAEVGTTTLELANRAFGERKVSVIFVDADTFDIFPELDNGEVVVCGSSSQLDSVTPARGPLLGGNDVSIRGEGLGVGSRVFFGSREAQVLQVLGSDRLDVEVPAGVRAEMVDVTVSSPQGCAVLPAAYEYQPSPIVIEVTPSEGHSGQIVVRGIRFAPESRVFVGDQELTSVLVVDEENLVANLGGCGNAGLLDVRVETFSGTGILRDGFRCSSSFLRGECNGDSSIDLADAVRQLFILFDDAPFGVCPDACDVNDDGGFDLADVVALVDFLFRSGPAPAEPFPNAGIDPTADTLDCLIEGGGDA